MRRKGDLKLNSQQTLISVGCLLSPANVMFGLKVEQSKLLKLYTFAITLLATDKM